MTSSGLDFSVEAWTFDAVVAALARITPRSTTHLAVTGMRLVVEPGVVVLSATDLQMGVVMRVPAEVATTGEVLLPGGLLAGVTKSANAERLSFALADDRVKVKAGRARYKIPPMRSENFPVLPELSSDSVKLPAHSFLEASRRVVVAASKDQTRPMLAGVRLECNDGRLMLAATDSYRVALQEIVVNGVPEFAATVPALVLIELARNASEEEIAVDVQSHQAVFSNGAITISSRLLDGVFPDVRAVVGRSLTSRAVLDRQATVEALTQVGLVASLTTAVRLDFAQDRLDLSVKSDTGEADASVDIQYTEEERAIAFNGNFLRAALEIMDAEKVVMSLGPGESSVIRLEPQDDSGFVYMLMPLRLP